MIEHHGDILFHLGRVDEAVAEWKKASTMVGAGEKLSDKYNQRRYID
jgi:predicted negative regulator of RcsB-dependent stress response